MRSEVEQARAIARLVEVPLPEKPRLAPWVELVDLGDDRLQFRSAEFAYTLSGRLFLDLFAAAKPLLDGDRTVDEICSAGGSRYSPATALVVLKMLRANGVLIEGNVSSSSRFTPAELESLAPQLRFLSHFEGDPFSALAQLREARVACIGSAPLRALVEGELERIGVCHTSGCRTEWPSGTGVPADVRSELKGLQLLIACQGSLNFRFYDEVNAACLTARTRWLRVAVEGTRAHLGPTFVPGQTACYACYEQRRLTHDDDPSGSRPFREKIEEHGAADEGLLDPLLSALAAQTALEAARLITGFAPPATLGRFYELDAASPNASAHDVPPVPRCPACGATPGSGT